jgi:hypothetical protein
MSVHGLLTARLNQIRAPWNTELLGKLPVQQLVKKFIAFYEYSNVHHHFHNRPAPPYVEADQSATSIIFLDNCFWYYPPTNAYVLYVSSGIATKTLCAELPHQCHTLRPSR